MAPVLRRRRPPLAPARPPRADRPDMPGYGLARTRRGLLPWTTAVGYLRGSRTYWLATTRPDGAPHMMPVWGLWLDDRFYFSTGRTSVKARNLARHPRCVIATERAEAAMVVEGTATLLEDPTHLARLAGPYARKYRPWKLDPALGPVFEVRPQVVFGLVERSFPRSATRWRFPAAGAGAGPRRRARPRRRPTRTG